LNDASPDRGDPYRLGPARLENRPIFDNHPIGQPHYPPGVGSNIRLVLPISLKEAVQGAKVKVPTPEGPVMLTIPKSATSGKVLRVKGRGFTRKDGHRGDMLVQLAVDVPKDDEALNRFVEGWSGGGNPRASLGV